MEHEVFPLELQIVRTEDMHRMAEYGISADREVKAAWRTMPAFARVRSFDAIAAKTGTCRERADEW